MVLVLAENLKRGKNERGENLKRGDPGLIHAILACTLATIITSADTVVAVPDNGNLRSCHVPGITAVRKNNRFA